MDGSARVARLVVADRSGEVLGMTDARPIPQPWWPETVSLLAAFADVVGEDSAIVRLLDAQRIEGNRIDETGWLVTYLAQLSTDPYQPDPATAALRSLPPDTSSDLLGSPEPLRMPWAKLGGPSADIEWALAELIADGRTVPGRPRQHKTWNLSSVWEIPVVSGAAWLKTTAPFGGHESTVLRLLDGHPVPHLLAAAGHRQLLAGMPGVDGFQATIADQLAIVDTLVDIQIASTDLTDDALAAGVPDRRTAALATELHERLDGLGPDVAELTGAAERNLEALERCGLPTVIVHGDVHPGNARIGLDPPVIFDWSDSFVGNPIWDLRRVIAGSTEEQRQVRDHWLERWAAAAPGSDPWRAAELTAPVAPLLAAATYQLFVDEIEPSERVYHRDDVRAEIAEAAERTFLAPPSRRRLPE